MPDPLRRLKFLPWRSLFLVAALTMVLVSALEGLITVSYESVPATRPLLQGLFLSQLAALISFVLSVAVGALAVFLLERFSRLASINSSILWSLILCLAVTLLIKTFLPLQQLQLLAAGEVQLIGIVVGVFWKGQRYWR